MALSISEQVSATLHDTNGKRQDNATLNNAMFVRLRSKGNVKTFGGGYDLREKIYYQVGQNAKAIGEWEQAPIDPWAHLTDAVFARKTHVSSLLISNQEMMDNQGKEQLIDLLESRIEAAEDGLIQSVAAAAYGDETADSGKVIGGLKKYIADNGAVGAVGGIDPASYTWWRNVTFDSTTDGGAAMSASTIQAQVAEVYMRILRGRDKPDLMLCNNKAWGFLHASMTAIQRINDETDVGKAGFQTLKFMGMDAVADGVGGTTSGVASVIGGGETTGRIYIVNSKYLKLKAHKDCNFQEVAPSMRAPVDQLGFVKILGFYGNLVISNRALQAVIKD